MNRYEKEIAEECKRLIKQITGFKEYEENFGVCLQFVTSNIKYHRFLGVDSHKITRSLQGVLEKFRVHSDEKKYSCLHSLSEKFLDLPVFEHRENGKTDTHYSVLQFLMLIADNPVNKDYVETKKHVIPEIKEEFNWGEYLLEGIERYVPSDNDLSDWSDDEEQSKSVENGHQEPTNNMAVHHVDSTVQPYIVSDGSTGQWEESSTTSEGMDWLKRNLVPQYWKGEKIDIDLGRYQACYLNNDWEAYKRSMDPLSGHRNNTVVTENILMREILWMLMGIAELYLLDFNGKYFIPKHGIVVPHLSEEALHENLSTFTRYGSYIKILEDFTVECYHNNNNSDPISQTLEAFSCTVGDFLQKLKMELSNIEQKLIKQEEILTLVDLAKILKPSFNKVQIVFMVYMKGVYQSRNCPLQTYKATQLLTVLYNMLMGCDSLFNMPDDDGDDDDKSESASTINLLLLMWLQTCQPYINIVDTWISHGFLTDPRKEFVIYRNKDIGTMDETFWEQSFAFHAMNKTLSNEQGKLEDESQSADWVPKFLQPVLQQIVLTGKSMEMLESLGLLAKLDGKSSLSTKEFKEGHLYDKFMASLMDLLGMRNKSDQTAQDQTQQAKDQPTSKIFTEDIERQMKEKDVFDSFLKIHFENLMQGSNENNSFLEESFVDTMKSLSLEHMKPIELILQECLYPHIHLQYENVCGRLVDILIKQYHLLDYLDAMRKFFLMEAGDTMFIFYTEIFDKIRLHEHWKDTTSLTFALQEALDSHYPDEVSRLNVLVESPDGQRDSQPINVTDCLTLHYQIPSPVDVVINERCQLIYNQVFRFLLQVKRAKYCLDELRFYDLQKPSEMSASDRLLSAASSDNSPRPAKLHRMHLLRTKLLHFVNNLHSYMMSRILHIVGMEFRNLTLAKDLDQIIEKHANYVKKIHESCLLHRKNAILKEAVLKVLNLTLRFQIEWDQGVDCISMSQIEETEMEFSRCIQFLSSFLNSVIQRGSFPHLEALAFGLVDLIPKT